MSPARLRRAVHAATRAALLTGVSIGRQDKWARFNHRLARETRLCGVVFRELRALEFERMERSVQ